MPGAEGFGVTFYAGLAIGEYFGRSHQLCSLPFVLIWIGDSRHLPCPPQWSIASDYRNKSLIRDERQKTLWTMPIGVHSTTVSCQGKYATTFASRCLSTVGYGPAAELRGGNTSNGGTSQKYNDKYVRTIGRTQRARQAAIAS